MALTLESIQAKVQKAEERKAKALQKAEEEAAKELSGLGEELTAQHTSAIESILTLERMMTTASVPFKSVFGGTKRASGTRAKRGSGADSMKGRMLLYLSGKPEASVKDIADALKLNEAQAKSLNVALSQSKKAGLTAAGSGRGFWKITPKGKEEAKSLKTSD